jgi:hypothetical protein
VTTLSPNTGALEQLRSGLPDHNFVGPTGYITKRKVLFVQSLVRNSGIAEQIDTWYWMEYPKMNKGGAPRIISTETVLTLILLLTTEHQPQLVEDMASMVAHRLSKGSLRDLGLWKASRRRRHTKNWYFPLYYAIHRLLAPIDPKPGRTRKFQTEAEFKQTQQDRAKDNAGRKQPRLDWVCNQLIDSTWQLVPEDVRSAWKGDMCVDASVIPAYGKRGRPWTHETEETRVAIEPDAGWYLRTGSHGETSDHKKAKKAVFGWDATIVVRCGNDPAGLEGFPLMAAGIGLTRPGTDLIHTARRVFESIVERGYPTGRATGDRGYLAAADENDFQIPLSRLGYQHYSDYKKDQLGKRDGYAGSIQVEGAFYCPSMPEKLIRATVDLRAGRIDQKTWRQLIKERRLYMLRPKEKPDSKGRVPMVCPARGPGATLSCPIADACTGRTPPPDDNKMPVLNPPDEPDEICTHKVSVSFPIEAGAKFRQAAQFGSDEWAAAYQHDRSAIEGSNGYMKDGARESIETASRRRLRGYAAQYLLITILVVTANLRRLQKFRDEMLEHDTDEQRESFLAAKLAKKVTRKAKSAIRVGAWSTENGRRIGDEPEADNAEETKPQPEPPPQHS